MPTTALEDFRRNVAAWADQWVARKLPAGVRVKRVLFSGKNRRYKIDFDRNRSRVEYQPAPDPSDDSYHVIHRDDIYDSNLRDHDSPLPINYSEQTSVEVTANVHKNFGFALPVTFNIPFVSGGVTFTHSKNHSNSETKTSTSTWTFAKEVMVPPKSKTKVTVKIAQGTSVEPCQVLVPVTGHIVVVLTTSVNMPNSPFHREKRNKSAAHKKWYVPIEVVFQDLQTWNIDTPSCVYKNANVFLASPTTITHNSVYRKSIEQIDEPLPDHPIVDNNQAVDNHPFAEQPPVPIVEQRLPRPQHRNPTTCKTRYKLSLTLLSVGIISAIAIIVIMTTKTSDKSPPNHLLPTTTPPPNGTTPTPPGSMSGDSTDPLAVLIVLAIIIGAPLLYFAATHTAQIKEKIQTWAKLFRIRLGFTREKFDVKVEPFETDPDFQAEPILLSDEEDFDTDSGSDSDSDDELATPSIASGSMASGASRMFYNPLHSSSSGNLEAGQPEDSESDWEDSAAEVEQLLLRSG